jgi:hypothetical protein
MDRVLLVLGGIAIAGAVAAVLGRRTAPPAANTSHIPLQLDRSDFASPTMPWLVAVFTSATCNSCAKVWERAQALRNEEVAVVEIEVGRDKAIHDRYKIDTVPTLVICDAEGAVQRAFLGPIAVVDLEEAITEVREPGAPASEADTDGV